MQKFFRFFGWCSCVWVLSIFSFAQDTSVTGVHYYRLLTQANEAYDKGDFARSEEAFSRLLRGNADDGDVWLKLGFSRFNQKKYSDAIPAFTRAIDMGFFNRPVGYYRIAMCYANLGDSKSALVWLERALEAGYRNKTSIVRDKTFASLAADPQFQKLSGMQKTDNLSRFEGWSRDISYLMSELRRMHYVYRKQPLPDALIQEAAKLTSKINEFSDSRMAVELQRLLAMVGDGHTLVYPFGMRLGTMRQMPLTLYQFSDGVFVIDAAEKNKSLIGKRIVKFGELPAEETIKRLTPYITHENDSGLQWTMPTYLLFADFLAATGAVKETAKISLTVTDANGRVEIANVETAEVNPDNLALKILPPKGLANPPRYLSKPDDNYWFEKIGDGTVYFQFNQVANKKDESLAVFSIRLRNYLSENKIKNLIIDVRRNNGGEGTLLAEMWRTLVNFETSRADARIYVLTGRDTFSAAQTFLNTVEKLTNATFIGEPPGARPTHVGDEAQFILPYSGVMGAIAPGFHQSSNRDDRDWIAPKVPVALSSKDYFEGRDPVLDTALKLAGESTKQ